MLEKMPTELEWTDWLQHPATKALHHLLRVWLWERKEQWASGQFSDLSQFGTAILNAKAIGECQMLEQLGALEYSQLEGVLQDDDFE